MIKPISKLIRFPNLIIIAATQYLMRHMIIAPFLRINGFELQLDNFHFAILVLSTLFIAAAGYTINDYFDTKTDRVNKPESVVIDKQISRQLAINLHTILNIIGVGLGIFLSFYINIPGLSLLFLLTAGLLWFYSTNYKRQFFIGNFVVSLLIGIVPMIVILFEMPLLNLEYGDIMLKAGTSFNYIFYWISGFSFFAFLTNFIREIVKDAEDFEGDSAYGMNTFPVKLGTRFTRIIIIFLVLILMTFLAFVIFKYILFSGETFDYISASYFLFTIFIPLLFVIFQIAIAKDKRDYHLSSQILKLVMLFGVLYSVIVFYMLNFRLN
ncbi:MAG: geranylgeranylglycerol-phosphate geranylgeranyltransferase [Bacteroidota bacterium]